jgi:autotransporter-associated beta strand protein
MNTSDMKRTAALPLLALFAVSVITAAQAQSTWFAGATNNTLWNKNLNWSPTGVPNSNSAIVNFGPPFKANPFVDLTVNVGQIQFLTTSPAYTITVNSSQSLSLHTVGITNQSAFTQTFVNNGILNFDSVATAGNNVSIINNLTLNFNDRSTAGTATITTNSGGITEFTNMSTGADARLITNAGGTVDISRLALGGTTAGSIEGAGTYSLGSKELTVGLNNLSTVVSGVIVDGGAAGGTGGSLIKAGTGTLTLTADNTYSGGTTIQAGTLVAGVPNAAQEISNALGTGNVFLQGGTMRTSSLETGKPLTINIRGNYRQSSAGTLSLGIGGTQGEQYDHLQVQGSANLNGTLAVFSLNGFRPVGGNAFGAIHTGGALVGQFAQVNDSLNNNPSLQRIDVYAPNGVALVYVQAAPTPTPPIVGPTPPPPPGPTPTPKPPIDIEDPKPLPPIDPEAPLQLPDVLGILDPTAEQLTAFYEISFSGANTQRFKLDERFADIQRGSTGFTSNLPAPPPPPSGKEVIGQGKAPPPVFQPSPQNRWGVWANGWGDWVSVDDEGATKGYNFTTGGFIIGVDYRITDYFAIGLMGSYAYTRTNLQPSGDIDVNTGRGGLYFTYFSHGFYINGAAYGGHNTYNTSRQGILGAASGSTSGGEFSTFGQTGYDFHFGNLSVGPLFALQYTLAHVDGFNERGSLIPLNIHSDSETSFRTDLGVRASYTWHVGSILLIPSVTAAWEHEYSYSVLPITISSSLFPGQTETLFGPSEGHDSAIVNPNFEVQWTPRFSTFVGYQGQLGRDRYDANAVTGGISFSF